MDTQMINLLIVLTIVAVFIFVGREIVCWYFKINEIVSLLKAIKDALQNKVSK
jgi:hypothetical protein